MGRYYSGNNNIEGKFWFGVQSSDDPEYFGMEEQSPQFVNYYTDDLEQAEKSLKEIIDALGANKKKLDKFFKENNGYNDKMLIDAGFKEDSLHRLIELYARITLGQKIVDAIKADGYCELECEV